MSHICIVWTTLTIMCHFKGVRLSGNMVLSKKTQVNDRSPYLLSLVMSASHVKVQCSFRPTGAGQMRPCIARIFIVMNFGYFRMCWQVCICCWRHRIFIQPNPTPICNVQCCTKEEADTQRLPPRIRLLRR